jgi:ABC-type oligopeptide transport system substrate-binding subunit
VEKHSVKAVVDLLSATKVDRRKFIGGAAAFAATGAFAPGLARLAGAQDATPAPLPADAAPAEKQTYLLAGDINYAKALDFYETVYARAQGASDLFSEPLVRVNKDYSVIPGAAESWSGSADGKTWTFKLRDGLMWTDGNQVTAADYVKTFQYGADPAHAWDFTWYWDGVMKGWHDAIAGKLPLDQLGAKVGANPLELIIETEVPAPYLPAMLLYSAPLSKAALEKSGPLYNTKVETSVSSGPFKLAEWVKDQSVTIVKNEQYTGTLQVPVQKLVLKLADSSSFFQMYQNNEIDYMAGGPPASLTIMQNDETTAKEIHSGVADFPTWYIFFDVTIDPWKDIKVRQAWSHAIDRDTLVKAVLGPNGVPAYSWLAPGFPASQGDALKDIQGFDPAKAKQLLSDAGFPDGKGFPKQQMWLRAPTPLDQAVANALAAMIKQNLNIDVELVPHDQPGFTAALNAKPTQIPLGYVRYGMDYLDPSNMLSVWKSGGRHSWSNPEFDKELAAASAFLGDPAERIKMFQAAEKILVEDVPAVFVYHGREIQYIKPWVEGEFITPDSHDISAVHWPGYTTMTEIPQQLYIGNSAPDR